MISYLTGKITDINEKYLTILTNSGVGYKVYTTLNILLSKNEDQDIELLIHTIVKEDALDLYGFENKNELLVFEKLITVSGVGPKSALAMLSVSSVESIAFAIENNDVNLLSRVPGIGKKTCEKIIIELKGKLIQFVKSNQNLNIDNFSNEADARLALSTLGYNEKDINNAINIIKNNLKEEFVNMNTSSIIKNSLQFLR